MESSRRDLLNAMAEHWSILKITIIRITPLFLKIELCSATSMESSRRDLLNAMAEHWSILKITIIRITPLFLKIELCSATSMESSRRDLLNDMAEHRPILKNNQNTFYLRFGFTPKLNDIVLITYLSLSKTGIVFHKTGYCFHWVAFSTSEV